MVWIEIMPGVYAGVPDEVQLKVEVKADAETTDDQSPGDIKSPVDWWEFEALEYDASELA